MLLDLVGTWIKWSCCYFILKNSIAFLWAWYHLLLLKRIHVRVGYPPRVFWHVQLNCFLLSGSSVSRLWFWVLFEPYYTRGSYIWVPVVWAMIYVSDTPTGQSCLEHLFMITVTVPALWSKHQLQRTSGVGVYTCDGRLSSKGVLTCIAWLVCFAITDTNPSIELRSLNDM